jgi:uncharacterized membrane protein YcaP (DUF421 family)
MDIVYRATVIYFFLWFVTRIIGKRELGSMSAFELIVLVTMGDLIQQGTTQEDFSVTGAMLAVGTFASLMILFSWLSFRFRRTRVVIEGMPVVVVQNGEMRADIMKYERVDKDELFEALREQGIDDVAKVRFGVLEPDGKFSFFTDEDHEPAPEPASAS